MIYLLAVEFVGDDGTINTIHKFYANTTIYRKRFFLDLENDTLK